MDNKIYGVSELNGRIKQLIDSDAELNAVFVRGELSNYKVYPSGHHYFTMKDAEGSIRCVMFKGSASKLRFRPESGMKVIAFGRVTVYPRDGAYQLYVNELTPDGVGDLHIAFEQLKEKLYKEGLFDAAHKKPVPRFPDRIAVITSGAGAAVRDVIRVAGKRWPMSKLIVLTVRVQGVEAPPEIVGALRYANAHKVADVIICGRGGGSIEDLWAFNDERVARAIYDSEIPVISAVGHEPDVTIADFVADLRAAPPSNGAELAVTEAADIREALRASEIRAVQALTGAIAAGRQRLLSASQKRVLTDPKNYIDDRRVALDGASAELVSAMSRSLADAKERYIMLASKLDAMSPLKVLGRGYSIVRKTDGQVVKSVNDVRRGDGLTVSVTDGSINCTAD